MMILLDTNVLGRLAHPADPLHATALEAVATARRRGYRPAIVPQVIYEFWVVATRPFEQNGFGMTVVEAEDDIVKCVQMFDLFRDERAIFDHWHTLVVHHEVKGKNAHDARLVAAMMRHGIEHLLTFNDGDFARFEGISVVNPKFVESLAAIS
jgi:predicted nucleic acid-binding protein